jgi:hypothetical protein
MSLKKTLDDITTRFANEILAALGHASMEELQRALPNGRHARRRPSTPETRATSVSGHALEKLAVRVVGHLRENGPTRSEDLRTALGIPRGDMVKALALATSWKMVSKTGEKRATTYKALKARGPKAQLTLAERLRAAPFTR